MNMRTTALAVAALAAPCTAYVRSAVHSRSAPPMTNVQPRMLEAAPPEGFVWATFEDTPGTPASTVLATVPPSRVVVHADAAAVGDSVWECVEVAARAAIASRGHFALGIPGGSVLKMLQGAPSWASACTLAYVNHKAVPMGDEKLATHAKAKKLFLDSWDGVNAIIMNGSGDAAAEAAAYDAQLKALPASVLPRDASGMPIFDMMLIGVGDDGHVGSLYPGREEVLDTSGKWVLPVEMKVPGSITLSLPVMANAKEVLIAACGVSEKSPQGKGAAAAKGIEGDITPSAFPAVGLRSVATWHIDMAAGGALSSDYADSFQLTMSRGDCNPPS